MNADQIDTPKFESIEDSYKQTSKASYSPIWRLASDEIA